MSNENASIAVNLLFSIFSFLSRNDDRWWFVTEKADFNSNPFIITHGSMEKCTFHHIWWSICYSLENFSFFFLSLSIVGASRCMCVYLCTRTHHKTGIKMHLISCKSITECNYSIKHKLQSTGKTCIRFNC